MNILLSEGAFMVARWIHYMSGVTWIGLLYYFNFVQGSFFNEIDAQTKNVAISKLVPRALLWFRWGAMFTFLSGAWILMAKGHQAGHAIYGTSWGVNILTGALLATLMFLNVWLIIWPNQKIVIANATDVLAGKAANPAAAAAGAKAGLASRTNTLFSIPMLLLMGMESHFSYNPAPSLATYWIITLVIILGLEANAIKGKMGPMTTVRGVIHCGVALTLVLFLLIQFIATGA
jgi:uncharacterized membrane protein